MSCDVTGDGRVPRFVNVLPVVLKLWLTARLDERSTNLT
jgi:hypothetical protein